MSKYANVERCEYSCTNLDQDVLSVGVLTGCEELRHQFIVGGTSLSRLTQTHVGGVFAVLLALRAYVDLHRQTLQETHSTTNDISYTHE